MVASMLKLVRSFRVMYVKIILLVSVPKSLFIVVKDKHYGLIIHITTIMVVMQVFWITFWLDGSYQ